MGTRTGAAAVTVRYGSHYTTETCDFNQLTSKYTNIVLLYCNVAIGFASPRSASPRPTLHIRSTLYHCSLFIKHQIYKIYPLI